MKTKKSGEVDWQEYLKKRGLSDAEYAALAREEENFPMATFAPIDQALIQAAKVASKVGISKKLFLFMAQDIWEAVEQGDHDEV